MARHDDPNDPNGSTRLGRDAGRPADRTEGAHAPEHARTTDRVDDRDRDLGRDERHLDRDDRHLDRDVDRDRYRDDHDGVRDRDVHTTREVDRSHDVRVKNAKTSAAAAFALVFGLAALFCALTGILSPFAVLFGIIGLILAFAGFSMTKRLGVTGKGVAIGGLVTSLLGLLIGAAVLIGIGVYVNDQGLDRLEQQFDNARDNIPSGSDVRDSVEDVTDNE